jgi:hypothetical protein
LASRSAVAVREAAIGFLSVASWLQPSAQLGVVHQANAFSSRIRDHCAAGKMSHRLQPGERISKRIRELPHLEQILRLFLIAWFDGRQHSKQPNSCALHVPDSPCRSWLVIS